MIHLEVITRQPKKKNTGLAPLLFVHGAWHGAWCWELFQSYFAEQGYESYALNLRGRGASEGHDRLRWLRSTDFVTDVAETVSRLPKPPILIGHSLGGYIIQKYMERHYAPAAILLAPVPVSGSLKMFLRLALRHPWQTAKCHLTLFPYALIETPGIVRESFFSVDMPEEMLHLYFTKLQDESYRVAWDASVFDLPRPKRVNLPPTLVLGAVNDKLFSRDEIEETARAYHTQAEFFPDMAHDMMLEKDWMKVAERIVKWLREKEL
jgi:pimeloyl-ACP methyl ester carboxylesterase